jgi:hypothetical protein
MNRRQAAKSESRQELRTRKILVGFLFAAGVTLMIAVALGHLGRLPNSQNDPEAVPLAAASGSTDGDLLSFAASPATSGAELPERSFLRNMAAALGAIQGVQDPVQQNEKLEALGQEIGEADLPAAIEFLNGRTPAALERDLKLRLIRRWAGIDPSAAAEWVSQIPMGSERQEAIEGVAIVWANRNLLDAAGWVRHLSDAAERNGGALSVAYEAARTDPVAALELAIEVPAGESRDNLVTHAASQWAVKNPAAALEWAKQISDRDLHERVLTAITTVWGEADPIAAATLAVQELIPGKQQDDAVVGIVQRWVQKKPQEAAAWVLKFPEGTLRDTALEELVKLWTDQDVKAAGLWLNGVADSSARDVGVGAYVTKIATQTPAAAARWVEEIQGKALRLRESEALGEAWLNSDEAAARLWIKQTGLSEATKARLLAAGRN